MACALSGSLACTKTATTPAAEPSTSRHAKKESARERKSRPLVAPPPAYGNKVVMAERAAGQDGAL